MVSLHLLFLNPPFLIGVALWTHSCSPVLTMPAPFKSSLFAACVFLINKCQFPSFLTPSDHLCSREKPVCPMWNDETAVSQLLLSNSILQTFSYPSKVFQIIFTPPLFPPLPVLIFTEVICLWLQTGIRISPSASLSSFRHP